MSLKICSECGGKIDHPRHGKKYCSDACKQNNYRKNRTLTPMEEKQENNKVEILELHFKKSEFEDFKNWCKEKAIQTDLLLGHDALESYCFFRRDIDKMRDFSEVLQYYNEKPEEWSLDLWQNSESDQGKEFKKFKDYFENDLVKFLD